MLDFNKAHSNSAEASKRKRKAEAKKKLTAQILASCEGKVSFKTFKAAEEIAGQRRKSFRLHRAPYHCFYCRNYHLGTTL